VLSKDYGIYSIYNGCEAPQMGSERLKNTRLPFSTAWTSVIWLNDSSWKVSEM